MTKDEIRNFQMEYYRQENELAKEIMELRSEIIALKREISAIHDLYQRSISMRVTAPLRSIKIGFSRIVRRIIH